MDHIYHQYISTVSSRLRNFRKLSRNKYNFSCPFCGDSTKNKTKARGYILSKGTDVFYYCHNDSGCNSSFDYFLYRLDSSLSRQFRLDKFRESVKQSNNEYQSPVELPQKKINTKSIDTYSLLTKITDLPVDHPASQYIASRHIPEEKLNDIWYTDTWKKFTNDVSPEPVYEDISKDHSRIVFPLRDHLRNTFALQGRALNKDIIPKYLTCKLDPDAVKIFGQDCVNDKEQVYILEGPIDSMFIRNGVAMAGSDVSLDNCPYHNNRVFVLDNEPRSPVIVAKYHKLLKAGEKVVSWKNCKWAGKDINDMILNNKSCSILAINKYLRDNTVSGLKGKLEIDQWKKC